MKTEILEIREQSDGYRVEVLIPFKELVEFIQENKLNVLQLPNTDLTDMEYFIMFPKTFLEENYKEIIKLWLERTI